jgi:parallel beta-helix repeat protein
MDGGEYSTITDAGGNYTFANLGPGPGSYRVRRVQQAGWAQLTPDPSSITAHHGAAVTNVDFALAAGTYYVSNAPGSNCSNTGAGSPAQPFCTIQAGADRAVSGDTVLVDAGTYTESVTVKSSGTATAAVVFTAADGASVTINGQTNGFLVSARSWVTIHGFNITDTISYGTSVANSSNITIAGNNVSFAGEPVSGQIAYGILLSNTSSSRVLNNRSHQNSDAGIAITNASTGVQVAGNVAFSNARGFERAAPGIDVSSPGNTIANNITFNNEDSGIQLRSGGNDNLLVNNVSYNNGDHGIDSLSASSNRIIGNSVYRNVTAGINVEGISSGTTLANNIAVDNALNSPATKGNIRVSSSSITGTTLDYDLVFHYTPAVMFNWNGISYWSLGALVAATGLETHAIQADPKWLSPGTGDFRLAAHSPAIDSANAGASGQSATDGEGRPRANDSDTPNTGVGPRTYDDRGALEFQPFVANHAPVLQVQSFSVDEGVATAISLTGVDVDGDTLMYSLDPGAPEGAAIDPATGVFTWTPTESQGPASYLVTVRATDDGAPSFSDFETITITVNEVNVSPQLSAIGNKTVDEGSLLSFSAIATDSDLPANTLTFSLDAGAPAGASISSTTGAFSWKPIESQGPASYSVTVRVTDNGAPNLSHFETITITVNEANAPPLLGVIGDQTVDEGTPLSFTATASDADLPANALAFSLDAGAPAGASINAATGVFTWTPTEAQGPGTYAVTVRVTDNGTPNLSAFETITITVNEVDDVNVPPVLDAIGNKTVDEGTLLTFTATATDSDLPANTLTFSLDAGAPAGASINPATGVFVWTPTESQGGASYSITVRVTDDGTPNLSNSETITVTVNDVNAPPVLNAIGDKIVDEGTLLSFTATATDPDLPANTLTFSLDAGAPAGASINPITGAFAWTPTESQGPGSYLVTIRVTDNGTPGLDDSETITITVNEVPDVPVTISFQDGVFPNTAYAGTRDTRLRSASPNETYGSGTSLYADSSPLYATLLKWDLSAIPPGSTVQSVSLTVNITDKSVDVFEIYELKRNWVENEASWNIAAAANAWQIAGAQGANDRGSTILGTLTASSNGATTINFNAAGLAVVQNWINQPATNHGIIIQDYTSAPDSIGFLSSETATSSSRPKLTVTYLSSGSSGFTAAVAVPSSATSEAQSKKARRQEAQQISPAGRRQRKDRGTSPLVNADLSTNSLRSTSAATAAQPIDERVLIDALDSLLSSYESIPEMISRGV